VGCLRYLTCTRPDILFGVGLVSRYMERPRSSHLKAAKRILRFIKGTLNYGLCYSSSQNFKITGRLLLVVQLFSLCWFYQSVSMGELSIFCSLLPFLSSIVYSFPCRGHLHPLLSLFLGICWCKVDFKLKLVRRDKRRSLLIFFVLKNLRPKFSGAS
jgi:hypothetical protein